MVILGFSGKCTAGKTTAAEYIKRNYCNVKRFSLANAMKYSIMEDFDLTREQVFKEKDIPIMIAGKRRPPRDLMIAIGNFYRTLDDDYWVRKLWGSIKREADEEDLVVIDDVRYPNEANFFTKHGPAEFIRIERPGVPLLDNVSETSLDNFKGFKGYIYNEDSLKSFYSSVDLQLQGLLASYPHLNVAKYSEAGR
jgi:hypothetical protein